MALPVYAPCPCGARLITLFQSPRADYSNCIGICNRVGCVNAEVKREGVIVLAMLDGDAPSDADGSGSDSIEVTGEAASDAEETQAERLARLHAVLEEVTQENERLAGS